MRKITTAPIRLLPHSRTHLHISMKVYRYTGPATAPLCAPNLIPLKCKIPIFYLTLSVALDLRNVLARLRGPPVDLWVKVFELLTTLPTSILFVHKAVLYTS